MIKAVIFDMDGVIIESELLWSEAIKSMLEGKGLAYDESAKVNFMGGGLEPELLHYKNKFNLTETVEEIKEGLIDIVLGVFDKSLLPKDGALDLLDKVSSEGSAVALATASPDRVMQYVVKKFDIEGKFQVMVSGDQVNSPKPAPDIYLLAAKKLDLDPKYCVAIEDSLNGAKSAKAAGMRVIGLTNRIVSKEDFDGIADEVVSELSSIEKL